MSKKTKIILVIAAVIGLIGTVFFLYQKRKNAGNQVKDEATPVTGGATVQNLY